MPTSIGVAQELREELLEAYNVLAEIGAVIDSHGVVIREVGRDHVTLSWDTRPALSYLFGSYCTVEQFRELLVRRDFNLCLSDGSCIQIYYEIAEAEIVRHRLAYYPCPVSFDREELAHFGLFDIIDDLAPAEASRRFKLVSPIRFDFDAEVLDDRHPYSHLTFLKDTCRLPVYGPVSVGHFLRFVLRYFHDEWLQAFLDGDLLVPQMWHRTLSVPNTLEMFLDTSVRA